MHSPTKLLDLDRQFAHRLLVASRPPAAPRPVAADSDSGARKGRMKVAATAILRRPTRQLRRPSPSSMLESQHTAAAQRDEGREEAEQGRDEVAAAPDPSPYEPFPPERAVRFGRAEEGGACQ